MRLEKGRERAGLLQVAEWSGKNEAIFLAQDEWSVFSGGDRVEVGLIPALFSRELRRSSPPAFSSRGYGSGKGWRGELGRRTYPARGNLAECGRRHRGQVHICGVEYTKHNYSGVKKTKLYHTGV